MLEDPLSISELPIWDAHCHGFEVSQVLGRPPATFWNRLTLAGMFMSSAERTLTQPEEVLRAEARSDPLVRTCMRRLAKLLGCAESDDEVVAARFEALSQDPKKYFERLWGSAGVAALLVDNGYPSPPVDPSTLESAIGLPVHQVARIEPAIAQLLISADSWQQLEDEFCHWVERAAQKGAVAFKSVIAYRSGLDVKLWPRHEVEAGLYEWRRYQGLGEPPGAKPVRDSLLLCLLDCCRTLNRPVHIHTGAGDPTVAFRESRPGLLFEVLSQHQAQPILLVHSGWPWLEEAAYLANAFPQVYLETSVTTPWSSVALDQRLEMLLGMAPPSRIMHGSDEATEPELIWLAALLAKEAWERVLVKAVQQDWYTIGEARSVAAGILAGNCGQLHNI